MAAYGGLWRLMADYGGLWRIMADYGGLHRVYTVFNANAALEVQKVFEAPWALIIQTMYFSIVRRQ
jgi:hypothetical protein